MPRNPSFRRVFPPWLPYFRDREGSACRVCLAAPERNRIKHTNEIVSQYMHWLDDEVFTECPTWKDCVRAGKIPRSDLEHYFGEADQGGPGHYEQSAKYGVGRRVLCNILEGTESEDSIAEALNTLPPWSRRSVFLIKQANNNGGQAVSGICRNLYFLHIISNAAGFAAERRGQL